jgi:periplasmic protein CpxP/Spy
MAALAAAVVLASGGMAMAQDQKAPEGKKKGFMTPEQRIERMSTELNLTADQKTKLTSLFEEQNKKMRELREDSNLSQEQRREKMQAFRTENDKKMKEILTPEQYTKWEKQREQMKGKGGGKADGEKKKSE